MRARRSPLIMLTLALLLCLPNPTGAAVQNQLPTASRTVDVRQAPAVVRQGKHVPLSDQARQEAQSLASARPDAGTQAAGETPEVGTEKEWPAFDAAAGTVYLKTYTLRGVGENIEVWVANELDFQEGDCRNGDRTTVTDEQVDYLIEEFDTNIFPEESDAFSIPPERDGTENDFEAIFGVAGYDNFWAGEGGNIVTLVDNVRDDNYFDFDNSQGLPYIAGFFYPLFNESLDRNVMSIDAYDWMHRTTEDPPNDPTEDLCTNAPARPFQYEGVFAHEYQHLLHYYTDPGETSWINEGLSDWAETLTGYGDPAIPITETGFASHIQCILGYTVVQTDANPIPAESGGPENSLTLWGDQGQDEILCDYGATWTLMEFLEGRYDTEAMTFLHHDPANGLDSLARVLADRGEGETVEQFLHDWAAMLAVDGILDRNGGEYDRLDGLVRDASRYQTPTLEATINWDNSEAYSEPGAPPNGSDYVRARDDSGEWLDLRDIESVSFDGGTHLPSDPVQWVADGSPDNEEDLALHSGAGDNLDRAIITDITVPADDPTLRIETYFDIEEGWDFGVVQISTDAGETWTSLPEEGGLTTDEHAPRAVPAVVEQLPGFTGTSSGWVQASFDLSEHAGEDVLLAFRYLTDPARANPGWWVDDVRVGDTLVSDGTDVEEWRSRTEVRPDPVTGWTVQVVTYRDDRADTRIMLSELALDDDFDVALTDEELGRLLENDHDVVGFIVTHDDPAAVASRYAPYTLTVNGIVQPGGGG